MSTAYRSPTVAATSTAPRIDNTTAPPRACMRIWAGWSCLSGTTSRFSRGSRSPIAATSKATPTSVPGQALSGLRSSRKARTCSNISNLCRTTMTTPVPSGPRVMPPPTFRPRVRMKQLEGSIRRGSCRDQIAVIPTDGLSAVPPAPLSGALRLGLSRHQAPARRFASGRRPELVPQHEQRAGRSPCLRNGRQRAGGTRSPFEPVPVQASLRGRGRRDHRNRRITCTDARFRPVPAIMASASFPARLPRSPRPMNSRVTAAMHARPGCAKAPEAVGCAGEF